MPMSDTITVGHHTRSAASASAPPRRGAHSAPPSSSAAEDVARVELVVDHQYSLAGERGPHRPAGPCGGLYTVLDDHNAARSALEIVAAPRVPGRNA
jgi:hypothetical protein